MKVYSIVGVEDVTLPIVFTSVAQSESEFWTNVQQYFDQKFNMVDILRQSQTEFKTNTARYYGSNIDCAVLRYVGIVRNNNGNYSKSFSAWMKERLDCYSDFYDSTLGLTIIDLEPHMASYDQLAAENKMLRKALALANTMFYEDYNNHPFPASSLDGIVNSMKDMGPHINYSSLFEEECTDSIGRLAMATFIVECTTMFSDEGITQFIHFLLKHKDSEALKIIKTAMSVDLILTDNPTLSVEIDKVIN